VQQRCRYEIFESMAEKNGKNATKKENMKKRRCI
jgi:hypothetical protein